MESKTLAARKSAFISVYQRPISFFQQSRKHAAKREIAGTKL